jgi:hypothetical protein
VGVKGRVFVATKLTKRKRKDKGRKKMETDGRKAG